MRFSSSALRGVAGLLAATLAFELALPARAAAVEEAPVPCLILRLAAPDVPDDAAGAWTGRLSDDLEELLRVRRVRHPQLSRDAAEDDPGNPDAEPAELARIGRSHDEARACMERLETADAARLLDAAARDAAAVAATDAGASLLAAILVTRGVLHAGEGDAGAAEEALAAARALRPAFVPDPALYSPRFLEAWAASARREPREARLVVRSSPDGAQVAVDGRRVGTTPAAVPARHDGNCRVRVERAGFVPAVRTVRCLPGRTATLEIALRPDRRGALSEALAAAPEGEAAARMISEAMDETGAGLAAVILVRSAEGRPALEIRSWRRGGAAGRLAGRLSWEGGADGAGEAARRAARMLVAAGWPPSAEIERSKSSPWYYKWWFWGLIGVAAAGVAIAVSGGGGSGGGSGSSGSTGSVDVTF